MKQTVEVCLSPDLLHMLDLQGKTAVVVDVLRATSCMASGLASGVDHIIPFRDVEECQKMKSQGYLAAGERNGALIPGMDMGNSPFEYMREEMKGAKVATTTTNGTKSIHMSKDADHIITGSFLNLSSVIEFIQTKSKPAVIVCAGWKGKVNLEDSLFAGNVVDRIKTHFEPSDDSSFIVQQAYLQSKEVLPSLIKNSEHAKRLAKFNIIKDIEFCSKVDEFDVVPIMKNGRLVPA